MRLAHDGRSPSAKDAERDDMNLSDFDYELPPAQIAQEPPPGREDARLLVLRREGGGLEHRRIRDLSGFLNPGDLLVVNDTRVRPARLFGRKESGGEVELLLLERLGPEGGAEHWSALARASRPLRADARLTLDGGIVADVIEPAAGDAGEVRLALTAPGGETIEIALSRCGTVPLPPYIRRERGDRRAERDRERYQTVFARHIGSAAAPTAGLHFTADGRRVLEEAGVEVASVTLHVGRGTFQPIRAARVEAHTMHSEWCRLGPETAAAIERTRRRGGRVVAVGTTVVRTLEARWGEDGPISGEGPVNLFIRPGYRFRAVDVLLTNFHLPRSTLLLLVSAFAGREQVLAAYREAVERGYRFYSFGDAMLVT